MEVGLTRNEAKAYIAILELGECKSGNIIKKSEIRTGRIYDILNSLASKGLISFIIRNNVKHFLAAEPTVLLDYLHAKEMKQKLTEESLLRELPKIIQRKRMGEKIPRVEVYEGVAGFKTALNTTLDNTPKGEEADVLSSPKLLIDLTEPFLQKFHRKRIAKGIPARFIYKSSTIETAIRRSKLKLSKVKILPPEITDPAYLYISGDYVITGFIGEKPITILIKSPEIAKGYRSYFDFLWERSIELKKFERTRRE